MFCPNCGNDCKDAKFCIKCGTKIQSEEVTQSSNAVWSVGMPCPHCGGTKLDGNNCAFCGAQLMTATPKLVSRQFPEPPIGRYFYGNPKRGYVEINEHSIRFYRAFLGEPKMERTILFKDVYLVSFVPARSMFNLGVLCVRTWRERSIPLTKKASDSDNDEACTLVSPGMNEDISRVYKFLCECADINAAREQG